MTDAVWRVQISVAADADFQHIIMWTGARFGPDQARAYAEILSATLVALRGGPRFVQLLNLPDAKIRGWETHFLRPRNVSCSLSSTLRSIT